MTANREDDYGDEEFRTFHPDPDQDPLAIGPHPSPTFTAEIPQGVWVPDAYLSRKAQKAWPSAVVYKLTLSPVTCYRLDRPGPEDLPPLLLNDLARTTVTVHGGPPINRFYEALAALKVVISAAQVG